MRQKKVWRYYCDHCNKGGCGKAAMAKHERHCIRNDNRECRMCASLNGGTSQPMDVLVAAARDGLDKLRGVADGCPICMLAAIVREQDRECDESGAWIDQRFNGFDYESERTEALKLIRESQREWGGY